MLLNRRLIFVTGKGGVGKTTVAAGLALLLGAKGRRTLVVEMDAKGALPTALGTTGWGYQPSASGWPGVWGMQMHTEDALREYLRTATPVRFVGGFGPLARTLDFLADAAPGVKEILSIGKVCADVRERKWDAVVVDAEATGHIVAQVGAPSALGDLVSIGAIGAQTAWMTEMLQDRSTTAVVVATTPEELAVNETLELIEQLPGRAGVPVSHIVANRVLPALCTRQQRTVLTRLRSTAAATRTWSDGARAVLDAVELTEQRRAAGTEQLRRLPGDIERSVIGERVPSSASGVVQHAARSLAEELDVELDDSWPKLSRS